MKQLHVVEDKCSKPAQAESPEKTNNEHVSRQQIRRSQTKEDFETHLTYARLARSFTNDSFMRPISDSLTLIYLGVVGFGYYLMSRMMRLVRNRPLADGDHPKYQHHKRFLFGGGGGCAFYQFGF